MYLMQPLWIVVASTASENVAVSVCGVIDTGGQYAIS
jgi:hypothetical protein